MTDLKNTNRPSSAGLAARRAASALVLAVIRDRALLSDARSRDAARLDSLSPGDQARAQRLATLALRHHGRIQAALKPFLQRRPAPEIQSILLVAMVELTLDLDAAHGIVNAAVALTREQGKHGKASGLVNAVLRRASEEAIPRWHTYQPTALPKWLSAPLRDAYGAAAVQAFTRAHAQTPPLDLTPKDPTQAEALAKTLEAELLPTGSIRLQAGAQVTALPGFEAGDWWVQDAAAAIPARWLAPSAGDRVLDLCAAPGGKTMQLAATGAQVTAVDSNAYRMSQVTENLARTKLQAELHVADALETTDGPFDKILLDAPCSATGTLRRHPDLPFAKEAGNLESLTALQSEMLDHALGLLRPGGQLVYCTCSLLPAEGEDQITAALARHPDLRALSPDPVTLGLPSEALSPQGLRLRPDFWSERGGMDGFFIANLQKAD